MTSRRKSSPATSRFHHFEPLESRQMMAGNLTAIVASNTLFINEAPGHLGADQSVQVSQLSNGHVKVEGLFNKTGGQTLINGHTSVEFAKPLNLVMGLGGGNDQIQVRHINFNNIQILAGDPSGTNFVDDDEVVLANMSAGGVVDIRTGGGRDNVFIQSDNLFGELKINTGVTSAVGSFDFDGVFIQNTTTRAATTITTGASGDLVRIMNSTLGNDKNDFLSISTGAGFDTVEIAPPAEGGNFQSVAGNIVIKTFDSASEDEVDTVRMQQLNFNSALIQLGGGNDHLEMLGVTGDAGINTNSTIQLEGMGGNDTMKLTEVELIDNFFALMGDGSDTLDMTFVKANKAMTLDGGTGVGTDRLEKHQMPFNPNLTVKNWEFINGIPMIFQLPTNGVLTAKLA